MFDYRLISTNLIKELPERTKDVISRRFGLESNTSYGGVRSESLESIGCDYGITRERVRQIEKDGLSKIKIGKHKEVVSKLKEKMVNFGGLKKEDLYIEAIGEKEMINHMLFLLSVSESFHRFPENKDFHSFWSIDTSHFNCANQTVQSIKDMLYKKKESLTIEHCANLITSAPAPRINSYLEISKHIHLNEEGLFGLKHWPEINPRSIKDKAYMALKKDGKPSHFREVALLIGDSTLPQTVHNELIKDSRFILIGRGIYALREWGYEMGDTREVIKKILLEQGRPLSKREIINEVLKKRIVKKNTILQNLSNKEYFKKDSEGRYLLS